MPRSSTRASRSARVVHQQPVERIHFHVGKGAGHLAQHFHALGQREQRLLFGVAQHGYHQPAENLGAALDQVEVPVGHRIERAGIDGETDSIEVRPTCAILIVDCPCFAKGQ